MFADFFARRKLKRVLSRYVSSDVADAFERGALDLPKIQSGYMEFVFILVRASAPEELSECLGSIARAGIEHHALVYPFLGPMVGMSFNEHEVATRSPASRSELVKSLEQQFGHDIKIVHGAAHGHLGIFGNESFLTNTFTFPQFEAVLATLCRLEFGQTEEMSS